MMNKKTLIALCGTSIIVANSYAGKADVFDVIRGADKAGDAARIARGALADSPSVYKLSRIDDPELFDIVIKCLKSEIYGIDDAGNAYKLTEAQIQQITNNQQIVAAAATIGKQSAMLGNVPGFTKLIAKRICDGVKNATVELDLVQRVIEVKIIEEGKVVLKAGFSLSSITMWTAGLYEGYRRLTIPATPATSEQ